MNTVTTTFGLHSAKRNKRSGFTLVEMGIVVALIGIIATGVLFVAPQMRGNALNNKGHELARQANQIVQSVVHAGGSVAAGASNDIDTTSSATLFADLASGVGGSLEGGPWTLTPEGGRTLDTSRFTVSGANVVTYTGGTNGPWQ